jgi:hypothetical protein
MLPNAGGLGFLPKNGQIHAKFFESLRSRFTECLQEVTGATEECETRFKAIQLFSAEPIDMLTLTP